MIVLDVSGSVLGVARLPCGHASTHMTWNVDVGIMGQDKFSFGIRAVHTAPTVNLDSPSIPFARSIKVVLHILQATDNGIE